MGRQPTHGKSLHEHWNETLDDMKAEGWIPRSEEEERELRAMYENVRELYEDEDLRWLDVPVDPK